ncbi:hypothetical protein E4T56_gene9136, partial [Termitomyces sp. T112]
FAYAKPVVAFMDGITMGGGVGISGPARLRVATPNTRLAMPESGIGLFPDVGGGWFLSRLRGRLGQYLALTGARLDGAECVWAGLATHYLPVEGLSEAKARIIAGEVPEAVLDALSATPPAPALAEHAADIARLFASDRLEDILAALEVDGGPFAARTLATIRTKSPTTCKVALRQLAASLALPDFAANMAMEYRIGARVLMLPDFAEGVRAVIIDKDNAPAWNPARPQEGAVTLITLNRPKALNALNSQVCAELVAAFAAFEADDTQGCAVLTGSGEKAFAAGADIKEMADKPAADFFLQDFFADWQARLVKTTRKPWIAAVNGFALGGGCELAMMADFILAADTAKFGQPEIKLGVAPGMGG